MLEDIQALKRHGIHVILVHGGGTQADELSEQLGHTPTKIDGRRITGDKDLEVVKMLFGGSLNLDILSVMKKLKIKGMRISGLDGNLLDVKVRCKKKVDFGFVGDVEAVNPQVLFDVLEKGYLPVVSPLGVTDDGIIVNINADTIATEIAIEMKAEKLILFTTSEGVYHGEKLLRTLTLKEAQDCIDKNIAQGGMKVKVENCIQSIQGGVKRVHIINGLSPHSLLQEVLTKKGVGTMIVENDDEKTTYQDE
jgi:acetylglutamate kinase